MTPAQISVIIPAINESTLVKRAIHSAQVAGANEIIVCDGGSDDRTAEVAKEAGARVFRSEAGRGPQLRHGAAQASGDYLLFLHADNELGGSCLEQICAAAELSETPKLVWGGFRQKISDERRLYRWLESGNAARIRYRAMPFGDQAMFFARSVYEEVGGVEAVPLMEDVKLSRALRRRSWPLLLKGPVHVAPRRWHENGVFRQTARNWAIQIAHRLGVKEERLAAWYHGRNKKKDAIE